MNKNIWLFILGILFAICCYICFSIGQSYPKNKGEIKIVRDTLVVVDTITIKEPIEKIRWKDKLVYVPIVDTLIINENDTNYIAMQIEKVEYEDKEYRAVVSGIYPKLEEISVYPKTVYVKETQKEIITKHWNFNITTGPGVFYNGKVNYGIGVILGFGYNF